MYVCILDQAGKIILHKNIPAAPQALLSIIEPFLLTQIVFMQTAFAILIV